MFQTNSLVPRAGVGMFGVDYAAQESAAELEDLRMKLKMVIVQITSALEVSVLLVLHCCGAVIEPSDWLVFVMLTGNCFHSMLGKVRYLLGRVGWGFRGEGHQ